MYVVRVGLRLGNILIIVDIEDGDDCDESDDDDYDDSVEDYD